MGKSRKQNKIRKSGRKQNKNRKTKKLRTRVTRRGGMSAAAAKARAAARAAANANRASIQATTTNGYKSAAQKPYEKAMQHIEKHGIPKRYHPTIF